MDPTQPDANPPSLLLVGHGSALSADSSAPVRALARGLRSSGVWPEVRVAFWKEEPWLHGALDRMEGSSVVVVPLFTSEGYFTTQLVPRELGIEGGRARDGRPVRVTPAVGTHPGMAGLVVARALEVATVDPRRCGLVIVGHGTERHPGSGDTTLALAEAVRASGPFGCVAPAFLDQPPDLADVLQAIEGAERLVVPFFMAEGWHAGTTIPRDLGRPGWEGGAEAGPIRYAGAVGTHPGMEAIVQELVATAVAAGPAPGGASRGTAREGSGGGAEVRVSTASGPDPWPAPGARTAFREALARAGKAGLSILELRIRGTETPGRWEVLPRTDADGGGPVAGGGPPADPDLLTHPDSAEAIGGRTEAGDHRPLRCGPGIPGGWRLAGLEADGVWEALDHLYPGLLVDLHRQSLGGAPVVPFARTAARHTGMYAGLEGVSPGVLRSAVDRSCREGRCGRTPLWEPGTDGVPAAGKSGFEAPPPCLQACPRLLAEVRRGLSPRGSE